MKEENLFNTLKLYRTCEETRKIEQNIRAFNQDFLFGDISDKDIFVGFLLYYVMAGYSLLDFVGFIGKSYDFSPQELYNYSNKMFSIIEKYIKKLY